MALTTGYDYDIFISYAHIDNFQVNGQTKGWIEKFFEDLRKALDRRIGRTETIKIWWDNKKLDGGILFNDSIKTGIEKSAVMICLNSPGYTASEYCRQELELFYQKIQTEKTGLKVGLRPRIINILLNNISFSDWPPELNGTTGFHFHDAEEPTAFGETVTSGTDRYEKELVKLKDALYDLLSNFPKEQTPPQPGPAKPEENKGAFNIYMGEVVDTLFKPRKRIIADLEKKGFNVLTGIPPPHEAQAHELATNKALKDAHVSIHLFDELPGREITGDSEIWYPQKQAELGLLVDKPQMIWVPKEIKFETLEDEKYKHFLQGVEKGEISKKEVEFVKGTISELSNQIIGFAEKEKALQMQKKTEKGKLSVLLDTHVKDEDYAWELSTILMKNKIQSWVSPQENNPAENISLMNDRLSQVNKLIFLYGNVPKTWVIERMSAALQLIITNNYPIDGFFIYMAPPDKEVNDISLNQKFININVINNSKNTGMNKDEFGQFLNALKTGTA